MTPHGIAPGMADYAITRPSPVGLEETEARLREALAQVGFGVLTEIDVKATLKKKLDLDVEPYKILGACNPKLASKGLAAEPELGVMLPCNVVVYAHHGTVMVSAMKPTSALRMITNETVCDLAAEAETLITQALDAALGTPEQKTAG